MMLRSALVATSPAVTSEMLAALLPPAWKGLTVLAICMTLTEFTCSPLSREASTLKPILAASLSRVMLMSCDLPAMRMPSFFQLIGMPPFRADTEETAHG